MLDCSGNRARACALQNSLARVTPLFADVPSFAGIPGAQTAEKATPEQLANVGCLVRATGAHQKISCMITAKEHRRFMQSYGNILKVSLDSLKKREKKKDLKKSTGSTKSLSS